MLELDRLLGFVAAHRNGRKVFHPFNMLLDILTNASYLSRPKAGSLGGSFHHLTRVHDPDLLTRLFRCTRRAYLLYARRCRKLSTREPSPQQRLGLESDKC